MAVLGSVDAIIFTAGIGENQPLAREKSLAGLENFGIILDREKNRAAIGIEAKVHHKDSTVNILVIPTNEELAIADDTYRIAGGQQLQ
jgi:acetate kinase